MRYHLNMLLVCFATILIHSNSFSQTACDSVDIVSIQYPLLTDTLLQLVVENNSSVLFDYPGFILKDSDGDTLAVEKVNYFGIGQHQLHRLTPTQNNLFNSYPQSTLELWSGFYDTLVCTYQMDVNFCSDDSCSTLFIFIGNFGGALAYATYAWEITDAASNVIESGQLVLDTIQQDDLDSVCIVPGDYSLSMQVSEPTGGQVFVSIYGAPVYSYVIQEPIDFYGNLIPFSANKSCVNIAEGIRDLNDTNQIMFTQSDYQIEVMRINGEPLGQISIFDISGKEVYGNKSADHLLKLPTGHLPVGTYLLAIESRDIRYTRKIVLK